MEAAWKAGLAWAGRQVVQCKVRHGVTLTRIAAASVAYQHIDGSQAMLNVADSLTCLFCKRVREQ